ncbi:MAG: hypothetical protein V1767_00790 [Chloroflexota bacterium]
MSSGHVRDERTYWRDEKLSEEHREWGWNCPAIDIDFLLVEYDFGKAVALVEYKEEHVELPSFTHPSYLALKDLGDRAQIPVFIVRYAGDFSWWNVEPINSFGFKKLSKGRRMTKKEWVTFLYFLRGRVPPVLCMSVESATELWERVGSPPLKTKKRIIESLKEELLHGGLSYTETEKINKWLKMQEV